MSEQYSYSHIKDDDQPIKPPKMLHQSIHSASSNSNINRNSNNGSVVDDSGAASGPAVIISDLPAYGTASGSNGLPLTNESPTELRPEDSSRDRNQTAKVSPSSPTGTDVTRTTSFPDSLSRFRRATQQIVHARRVASRATRGQGVDVSDMDSIFNCIECVVDVTVMDLNQSQYTKRESMNNEEFLEWLRQPRPAWSKVRWININGMSWDVIKAISIKYNLHHLAVEDLLHVPQRTKVDIYPQQTYIACTLLTLMQELENGELRQVDPTSVQHGVDPDILGQRMPLDKLDHYRHQYPFDQVTGAHRVQMEQVTMFLLQDGTLITLFQVSGRSVVAPIFERLTHDYSIVRKNNDASFLLQSVMDGIVDHAIPITDAFRQEINELETHVLALPRMKFTKELHQMTAQLSLLKRTLAPTQTLVHALRGKDERSPLSSLSRTYMGDVMDHCNTMVEDIDSMLALCEKLIDMIFNIIAYDTNESMRRLALVSIIFLPITFVAGVYGTNFENFPELKNHVSYFWTICAVVTAFVLLLFGAEYLMGQYRASQVERRLSRREPISIGSNHSRKSHEWCM
ncbi:hypothetical protein BCR41DRAFT_344456 [Lobosporangium transversale]|uniref:Uncharacterized protein n=1 Tax=Lobosporangium transversale TaxID=64571 RepID=A0A1Y2H7M8_9FUNG|nr:hypothetical protein BCR41DRAFT_344456 [Lobosporangium transversale]ORZ29032.1 hypothetical protein BCR41DRAFT_344456 [Lobosporangium transversale]|eukprot:XP_021886705.1 hypothetical protein BCR41DRAFT_344456 [Lobosporangium transversale]